MKTLTLLRHAKSGEDADVKRDFDRRLNAKGRRAARAMGRHLKEHGFRFDRVVASPALRVAETIEEVAAGYEVALDLVWERRIYLATADELLDIVRETPPQVTELLLVGHNPGLEDLVLLLVSEAGEEMRHQVEEKYPTASIARIALDIAGWGDTAAGRGQLSCFVRPRDLDASLGPDAA